MELNVEYVYVYARYGLKGALSRVGKKIKVLSVFPQNRSEENYPVVILYDIENKKIIGLGPSDDLITLGLLSLASFSNSVATINDGKIISIEIPEEFLENPLQFKQRTLGAFM
jgi:hypothetical protein